MYDKELCNFMYKYKHGLLPQSFDHIFTDFESVNTYDTRNKANFGHEIHKLTNFRTTGPLLWNNIPNPVKSYTCLSIFKKRISAFLQEKSS